MKKLLLFSSFLFIGCHCIADTTKVTGWHYENEITYMEIQFDFGWAVFQLQGDHIGDVNKMVTEGCILTKRWGLFFFQPVPKLSYVNGNDKEKILKSLNIKTICSQ